MRIRRDLHHRILAEELDNLAALAQLRRVSCDDLQVAARPFRLGSRSSTRGSHTGPASPGRPRTAHQLTEADASIEGPRSRVAAYVAQLRSLAANTGLSQSTGK